MRNSIIRVTAFDIERGRKHSYTYNPIARAIWQRLVDRTLVQLLHDEILIAGFGRFWFSLAIPSELLRRASDGKRDLSGFPFYDFKV